MLCRNVSGVLSSRCGDDTHRRILQPCFYGRAHGGTERIIHAVRYAFLDFVFVAHPHLEIIDDERREGGYFLALAWQRATRPATRRFQLVSLIIAAERQHPAIQRSIRR